MRSALLIASLGYLVGCSTGTTVETTQLPAAGSTYVISGPEARLVEPEFSLQPPSDLYLLVGVRAYDGEELGLAMAQAELDGEELTQGCGDASLLPPTTLADDGRFATESAGSFAMSLDVGFGVPIDIVISNARLSGRFDPPGDQIADALIEGELDVVQLEDLIGFDWPQICAFAPGFLGAECGPCANGTPSCIDFAIDPGLITLDPLQPAVEERGC